MSWHEKYLDIPFVDGGRTFSGCDCAGLVILVYAQELGLSIADAVTAYTAGGHHTRQSRAKLDMLITKSLEKWEPVDLAHVKPFDVVRYAISGIACHCAVYVGQGLVLHVEEGKTACLARINSLYGYTLAKVVRYVK